jgi:hypothetical protein
MNIFEIQLPCRAVPSREMTKRGRGAVTGLHLGIQNGKDPLAGSPPRLDQLVEAVKAADRLIKHPDVQQKGHEFSNRHAPF